MNYHLAAQELIKRANDFEDLPLGKPLQDPAGLTPAHARWMLLKIQAEDSWSDSKRGRWLGWAQAILCFHGYFELEEMKALNAACSCEDEGCPQYNTLHVHVLQPELSKETLGILQDVSNFGGLEIHKDQLEHPTWKELLASGHVDQGPFRGPDKAWCRVVIKGEPIT